MNLIKNNKGWIKYKNKGIKYQKNNKGLLIDNQTDKYGFIILKKIYNLSGDIKIKFEGVSKSGTAALLYIMDFKKNIIAEVSMNSDSYINIPNKKKCMIAIKMPSRTSVVINNISIENYENEDIINENLKNDILVIAPSYPSLENKYLCGFVHSRLKSYKENGIKFDLIVAHNYIGTSKYEFEGIEALKMNFSTLRNVLQSKKYKKILLHFFDYKYSNILDAVDLSETQLYLWVHGPETLYWDWPKFTTPYFCKETELNLQQMELFKKNDKLIKRYNDMPNVTWVFVSNWIKNESEKLINIKFNNYRIIPNIIDEKNFDYKEKTEELRKKIFFVRRFDNCNKYAIDVSVRAILELSRRDFFEELEFNIYGIGDVYDTLVEPLRKFQNVNLYPKFLSHDEISKIHKENGIALFPTRYDAQGVSLCEAAMSGLAIVTSTNDAVKEFLPNDINIYANTENYIEYANIIEELYKKPEYYKKVSQKCHKSISEKCSFEATVKKEIDMIKENIKEDYIEKIELDKSPILSIIIPSYNVEKYLTKGVATIFNHTNSNKIEVIIVNDGSKDNTLEVAKKLVKKYNKDKNGPIVIIDKENGGHGSTINEGIKIARGKYTRIIDGDDWVDSEELSKLVDKLENENSDIVVTDYSEDRADIDELIKKEIYTVMLEGQQYIFDDLCYNGYGFNDWGPILATANFKTSNLKKMKYKLSEKSFYVDMEFDLFSIINAQTITYYPLDIYRYFIGRIDQSISKASYIRNYLHHQRVLFRIIEIIEKDNEISEMKKQYAINKIVIPMIVAHYTIVSEFMHSKKVFKEYEKELKKYPNLYNEPQILTRYLKFQRKTNGSFLRYDKFIRKVYNFIKNKRV